MSKAERWAELRASMQLPPPSNWDGAITQHIERERPVQHKGSINGDRRIEGRHARKWAKRR